MLSSVDDLECLSREELIGRIRELEQGGAQMDEARAKTSKSSPRKRKKANRPFDFAKYGRRYVALKLAYLGWDYRGFASQTVDDTVEVMNDLQTDVFARHFLFLLQAHLFAALLKVRLIESRATCRYSRCGRTDKGVSALGQVISLCVRSNLTDGPGIIPPSDSKSSPEKGSRIPIELDYVRLLNKALPKDIRIMAWSPVPSHFDARFSCLSRTYKYFFPRTNLNIELMNSAAQKFVGEHDFRNFCKMDIGGGVTNFVRRILYVDLQCIENKSMQLESFQLCAFTVCGQAFLWHQIRCMIAVLILIGLGLEKPEVIDHMLDVRACPGKPQYSMASEHSLLFYDCAFEDLKWICDADTHEEILTHFQDVWAGKEIRSAMLREIVDSATSCLVANKDAPNDFTRWSDMGRSVYGQLDSYIPGLVRGSSYRSILDRPSADTLEERLASQQAKRARLEGLGSESTSL
ncbi:tRNA pseudouridine(38/39) synthase-like isoform X2 [Oscarella lobularis]|uniref:tRNA pseudouridine(38/39) synthase-like isoform X2 n=1 Tax=Oscarella lobularis TaxID=121494 RepID=UPI00331405F9